MQSQAVPKVEKTLGKVPNVSSEQPSYVLEDQLALDLGSCQKIETGNIASPTRQEAIENDFAYALRTLVEHISQDVESQKETILSLNGSRKISIAHELDNITSEINEFKTIKPIVTEDLEDSLYASFDSLLGKGMTVFCSRTSYFTAIRLMLIHYLKGMNLIESFGRNPYKEPTFTINSFINKNCANLIAQKHNWLFSKQNNYSWYKISLRTLNEIENVFSYWQFKEDSVSLLSHLYERYLDENSLKKYTHYTPPLVVRFMWDFLLDHSRDKSLFRKLGNNYTPKLIFDPTAGSGNFLMEAAARFKQALQVEKDPDKVLANYCRALTKGLYGCDLDFFAHTFSEIKILWLLADGIYKSHKLNLLPHQKSDLSISVIHQNALKLYSKGQLDMVEGARSPSLSIDQRLGLLPLEGHLKKVHLKIQLLEKFDFCVGCPPEQVLKEQKNFIKETIQKMPYWKNHYEQNLLYSSWFFVLGLSKLREAGKLIYITETYWPTEDGASQLRKFILQQAKVTCVIDLGELKLKNDKTTLPRYITLLEKCSSKEDRDDHKIKLVKVHIRNNQANAEFTLSKILDKAQLVDRPGKIYTDDDLDIFFSGVNQGELDESPWQQIYDTGFSRILKRILSFKTTLNYFCAFDENNTPSESTPSLMTAQVSKKNNFQLYKKQSTPGNTLTLTPKPICKESIYYLMALLNSPVLNFWYTHNGSKKNNRAFYEKSSLKLIPIRPINFEKRMDASIQEEKINQIEQALKKFDFNYLMANLNLEVTHGSEEVIHDAIVLMQKQLLILQDKLKRYDSLFMTPISQMTENDGEPQIDVIAFKQIYPPNKHCALREHKKVFLEKNEVIHLDKFCFSQYRRNTGIKNEGEHLILMSKDNKIMRLFSDPMVLDFIEDELKNQTHNFWDEIEASILLPQDLKDFEAFKNEIVGYCLKTKRKQWEIQTINNQLIYKLYGFNVDDKDLQKAKEAQEAIDIMEASF